MQGISAAFTNVIAEQHVNRLYVMSRISMIEPLPSAYLTQIQAVPGVSSVAVADFFGGHHQDPKNQVMSLAVDVDAYLHLYPEVVANPADVETMAKTRSGVLIGTALAKKFGWKVGDRIPVSSFIYPRKGGSREWPLDVVGIVTGPAGHYDSLLLLNHAYFDEARLFRNGTVGYYMVGIADPEKAGEVAAAIDKLFANSPNETRTQTEKELAVSQIKQIGDIGFLVNAIVGAVFFTLLFLTGNTMMHSFNERVPEFAVLKTLGFFDAGVAGLVLGESLLLCAVAAALGLALSAAVFPAITSILGFVRMSWTVILSEFAAAAVLALVSGLPPALRGRRLSIVDALADL